MSQRLTRQHPAPAPGIVHFGLGAFFRAHGMLYVEEAMRASGGAWGVVGVSLRSPGTRDSLEPQGWVYHAVEMTPDGPVPRVVTALNRVLVAPEAPEAVHDAMDEVSLVTLTITEKGYCYIPSEGSLDRDHPDIAQDLATPERPASAMGYIVRALDRRRRSGRGPFTVLSCDNIPGNGALLRGLILDLAGEIDGDLRTWIAAEVAFPASMVDRIVPAVTDADLERVETLTGSRDQAPVMHEPFRQWVVEDRFCADRPDLGAVGAELVADVAPYERMKLRCLNGTHSALAYLGYLAGAETMDAAVDRDPLADYVRHLWSREIIPVLAPPPGVDLEEYADALFERFANPAMQHRTWQIAMDGSQKLPQRILGTLAENLDAGRTPRGLILAVAAWIQFTSGRGLDGDEIEVKDPLAERLAACWDGDPDAGTVVARYLQIDAVFDPHLAAREGLAGHLATALNALREHGAETAARDITTER